MDKSIGDMKTMAAGHDKPGGYTFSVDAMLGQYRIVRPLGRGGMGEVYEVEHITLGKRYALKLLPMEFAAMPGALERFRREARVMANLDHPNIVKVDEFGEFGGRYWLRMELANGLSYVGRTVTSLQELAEARGGRVEQKSLIDILTQILHALKDAHGHGTVHRDLKPSNILIFTTNKGSDFKIADFGLVRLIGEEWVRGEAQLSVQRSISMSDRRTQGQEPDSAVGTSTRSLLGTYEYMSPEQKQGEEATVQSDIYSVGLMAFKLLTGQNPGLKTPSRIDATLNKGWDDLLERALEENAGERWASADEMLRALETLVVKQTLAPPIASEGRAPARPVKGPADGEPWTSPDTGMEFVWVPALKIWVGKYEVTNSEYRKKNPAHDSNDYQGNSPNGERQPVVYVNFDDAVAYAAWLTERDKLQLGGMRYRMPTEVEWQAYAQCGDGREYPWGNSMPPKYGNYKKTSEYDDGYEVTCPVEKSGRNDWGLYGVGGNVWECCASDASGSSFGAWRGASWSDYDSDSLRCAFRFGSDGAFRNYYSGFRLVLSR